MKKASDKIEIRYVKLSEALAWDWEENPKLSDLQSLSESIERYGFVDPPKYDAALERFVYGNHRVKALAHLRKNDRPVPRGIIAKNGDWYLPVKFGVDQKDANTARALALDHNNIGLLGGDMTAFDLAKLWDQDSYTALLQELAQESALPISVSGEDVDSLLHIDDEKPNIPADIQSQWMVIVECADELEQTNLLQRFIDEGLRCRALLS